MSHRSVTLSSCALVSFLAKGVVSFFDVEVLASRLVIVDQATRFPRTSGEEAVTNQPELWGPLLEGVVSSQRYLSRRHMVVRVLKSGRYLLRKVCHKKLHEKSFL